MAVGSGVEIGGSMEETRREKLDRLCREAEIYNSWWEEKSHEAKYKIMLMGSQLALDTIIEQSDNDD